MYIVFPIVLDFKYFFVFEASIEIFFSLVVVEELVGTLLGFYHVTECDYCQWRVMRNGAVVSFIMKPPLGDFDFQSSFLQFFTVRFLPAIPD